MSKKLTLVVVTFVLAVAFALPVSALVAGLLAWLTSLTFWSMFVSAAISCGVTNSLICYPRIKAQLDWANNS